MARVSLYFGLFMGIAVPPDTKQLRFIRDSEIVAARFVALCTIAGRIL
jgi:hypothetical protein